MYCKCLRFYIYCRACEREENTCAHRDGGDLRELGVLPRDRCNAHTFDVRLSKRSSVATGRVNAHSCYLINAYCCPLLNITENHPYPKEASLLVDGISKHASGHVEWRRMSDTATTLAIAVVTIILHANGRPSEALEGGVTTITLSSNTGENVGIARTETRCCRQTRGNLSQGGFPLQLTEFERLLLFPRSRSPCFD